MGPFSEGVFGVGSYLLGAIPFGLLLARAAAGVDVRQIGSGNIGATNVSRAAGKRLGALVLALDCAKAWGPTFVAQRALPSSPTFAAACGMAAVLGHCFPIYLRGRGGKGVASALGATLALAPAAAMAGIVAFAVVATATRVVALGSLAGSLAAALAAWALGCPVSTKIAASAMAVLILIRHRENLRLLARTGPDRP